MHALGRITGGELREILTKKSAKGACGVDGWRMAELKLLPVELLQALADVLTLVEETGCWPAALRTALVSMIPKGEGKNPLDMRPITVTCAVYRLWACRRLRDIMKWQECWVEANQHGFRPGHRGEDVLMRIGVQIEDALLGGEPLHGVALDFSKCFDRVPQGIVLDLARDLGMHEDILRPLSAMYRELTRRFKFPLGVGAEFEVSNGILQGCPLSVILINALLSVLMKAVAAEAPGVSTESYADDATLLSRLSRAKLQGGIDIVDEFCSMTGMKLNLAKTVSFSTEARESTRLLLRSAGEELPASPSFKCLGATLWTTRAATYDSKRVEAAAEAAAHLKHAPLPFHTKSMIARTALIPAALAGCSFGSISKSALKKLQTSLLTGIWGTKNPR
jgi:hypothetical protein